MYRDDDEAARLRADAATAEAERLRRENQQMRQAIAAPPQPQYAHPYPQAYPQPYPHAYPMMPPHGAPGMVPVYPPDLLYKGDVRMLPLQERARLAQHTLQPFPVVAAVLLNLITFGIFGWIYYSFKHDRLPKAAGNDPSGGKAFGFHFIPYYNLYWMFFNGLRLVDRLTLQFKLRGLPDRGPRGMVMAACIVSLIPYVNLLIAYPILWSIAVGMLQRSINKLAALPATSFDASPAPAQPGYPPPGY